MHYQILLVFVFAMILASRPVHAQTQYDPYADDLYDSSSNWDRQLEQDRQDQYRQLEDENRRLRALREQQRNEKRGGAADFGASTDINPPLSRDY